MLFSILLCIAGLVYLGLGWFGREYLLQTNPCQMTYTTMAKSRIVVKSKIVGPRLYKHPSGTNVPPDKLNPQPVLFIPGNRGR